MSNYTKGPWKVHKKTHPVGCANWEIHWSDDGECVTDGVYEEADARLIAAAPELLEALKLAISWLTETPEGRVIPQVNGEPGTWLHQAQQAIAKAEGTP